ncbi:jmjC domain-containing histone demethylation protein 1-like [Megalobrama amblycephala]|nr:jmjC domain-containing histone demethylation protein 1-like [Megalobrama amblycephala]
MRHNRLGKEDLVNIEWKTGHINHTVQEDATSCGVFVLQMIKETVKQFPVIPQEFQINPSAENIQNLRREMARDILLAAESNEEFCSTCGLRDLPNKTDVQMIDWIQCDRCCRWFHILCVGLQCNSSDETEWFCELCRMH